MKVKEAKKAYYELSGILSERMRNLCFAGIAIVWIFRVGDSDIPDDLLLPLVLFVLSLSCDLLHYIYASAAWRIFYRMCEKKGMEDDQETLAPSWINRPSEALLILKVIGVGIGYLLIAISLISRI
jgi:hypothetical protein